MTAGFFHSNFFPDDFWSDDFWPEHGESVIPDISLDIDVNFYTISVTGEIESQRVNANFTSLNIDIEA